MTTSTRGLLARIKAFAFALLALSAGAAQAATATAPVTLSSSAWTLVGSGPLNIAVSQNYASAYIWLRESDAQPAVGAPAQFLLNGSVTNLNLRDAAPVWAIVANPGAVATLDVTTGIELPSTGGGGGGGSNASVGSTGSAAPANATAAGFQNAAGNLAIPSPSAGLPISDTGAAATGVSQPTGGSGLSGWLSGIYSKLSNALTVTWSGSPNVTVANSSLAVTGAFYQGTQPVSATALPLPAGAAADGTDATGATQMTGGVGIRGWLSGIYSKLSNALTVTWSGSPNVTVANSSLAVTGTFYQATQPVSASSLPLPSGAATAANQAAIQAATGSAAPANAQLGGAVSSGNLVGLIQADSSQPINISTATTTQLVALSSGKKIYLTAWDVLAGGTGNITLEYGTGTACATGTTVLTGAYSLTAQAGLSKGAGLAPLYVIPAGNALCALTSAAVQMSGSVSYTQF